MSGDREHLEDGLLNESGIEAEPRILATFEWVDEEGVRGEKGIKYDGVIKYAEEKDREGIMAVEGNKQKYRAERGEQQSEPTKDPEIGGFERAMSDPDAFAELVLTIEGQVVAHVALGKDPNRVNAVELATVTTMEKYKRNRFMKKLFGFVKQESQNVYGADTIRVRTQEDNEESKQFYTSAGYAWEGERVQSEKEWRGKSPHWQIIFVKHLEKPKE